MLKKECVKFYRRVVGDENTCLDPRKELYKGKEMQNEETLQSFTDAAVSVHQAIKNYSSIALLRGGLHMHFDITVPS